MARRLIGLVGYAGVGKDVVAEYLADQHEFARLASGDLVRSVLEAADPWIEVHHVADFGETFRDFSRLSSLLEFYGWEATKRRYPEVRRLLQDMGTEGVRKVLGADVWIDETLRVAKAINEDVCITDTRFPNEAEKVRSAGGHIWRIERPGVGPVNSHSSETLIDRIRVDATIHNDSTIEDLYSKVDAELTKIPPHGRSWQWEERSGYHTLSSDLDPWENRGPRGQIEGQLPLPEDFLPQARGFTGGPLHIDVI